MSGRTQSFNVSEHFSNNSENNFQTQERTVIDRVEPPFWWVGMKEEILQLMIHGDNVAQFDIQTSTRDWQIENIHRTTNSNYVFVDMKISATAKPGSFNLNFVNHDPDKKDKNKVHSITYELKQRKDNSHLRKGFSSADTVYLITPDRFANADVENDQVKFLKEGVNRQDRDGRHGGDLQGIINHLDYIEAMGFSQIWLNPVLLNNHEKYTYHGYAITDLYQIDKRFGDHELYKQLSKKARQKNIGLIKDVVLNHIGSEHWWMKDLPSENWINHNAKFVPTSHKRESLHDLHGTDEDRQAFVNGWFVPTMADLNQKNPLLANYLIQNNIWWVEYADLSGIRIDTFSYSDKSFLSEYTHRLMQEYPEFNLVAEEWTTNPVLVSYWQRGKQRHDGFEFDLPSLMDFPLQDSLVRALTEKESWSDGWQKLYNILASDFIYANASELMVFPDNHDMSRIYTQLDHDLKLTKLAVAFIATTRGIPQFFYGTEILMENRESDSHGLIRSDFPGGWLQDDVSAFSQKGLSPAQKSMQDFTAKLLNWRKHKSVMHTGKLTHYAPKNGVYVYFRQNSTDKVMVVLNKNTHDVEINPQDYPTMLKLNGTSKIAKSVLTDKLYQLNVTFKVAGKSALILDLQ